MAKHKVEWMRGIFLITAVIATVEAAPNTTTQATTTQATTTPAPAMAGAQYVISHEGKPCLMATFNASIRISYVAMDGFNQTFAKTAKLVSIGDDAITLESQCAPENNFSSLVLSWALETFKLQLDFTLLEPSGEENNNGTWSLTSLTFTYDKADKLFFSDAAEEEVLTVTNDNLTMFSTPLGHSYLCAIGDDVLAGEIEKGAAILFTDIQLEPFGLKSEAFDQAIICDIDEEVAQMERENLLVPVVVASCLAGIILIVILVYVITRNVNKSNYKQMD